VSEGPARGSAIEEEGAGTGVGAAAADPTAPLRAFGAELQAPPPAGALLASVATLAPVPTRVPLRALLGVVAVAGLFPVGLVAAVPLRADLLMLPRAWLVGTGLFWLAGFVVPLALAFLPPRGQVLPDGARAGRAALLAVATLGLLGLLFTVDAPGHTLVPPTTWAGSFGPWRHCIFFGLKLVVPFLVLSAFVLRRVAVVSVAGLGAAIGAAAGALAGLTLLGLCPYGGAVHVGLAHGGGVAIGATLGALWLPAFTSLTYGRTSTHST
jgi:hypothetical protein